MSVKMGLDLGMSSTKLVGASGEVLFFNQAALLNVARVEGNFAGMRNRKRPMVVKGEFGEFYVGKNAHDFGQRVESFDFEHLTGTNEMRALVYGALTMYQKQYGIFDDALVIAVGLPWQMITGKNAKANQAAVQKWLVGEHAWTADDESMNVTIETVKMAPQAIGALFDYSFLMTGEPIEGNSEALQEECAQISIGSNTIELMVTKRNAETESLCGGQAIGVRKLFQRLDQNDWYSYGELDLKLRGKDDKLTDEQKKMLPGYVDSWWNDVKGFIDKKWEGKDGRFHRIFIVGGGVYLLEKHLRTRFNGRAYVPENPVMSIARGLYKLLLVSK